jgi:hypothetical protein
MYEDIGGIFLPYNIGGSAFYARSGNGRRGY